MMNILSTLRKWGTNPDTMPEFAFKQVSLLLTCLINIVFAVIWGLMYYALYGFTRHAMIPFTFALVVGVGVLIFIKYKNYTLLSTIYLLCILCIPCALQISLGGLVASGTVILWMMINPIAALIFQRKQAHIWLLACIVLLLLTIVFDSHFTYWAINLTDFSKELFPFMNILGPSLTLLLGMRYFVDAFYREHAAVQIANKEIKEQKEELNTTLELVEIERTKSDKLLLNILPEEVAQELKEKGFSVPKQYELVTVLFTDFKGFTHISEKISPTEVIENLNTCFLAFDEICDKYNLEKIKTIGDAYMCAGGVPIANETNPVDVVLAGLAMQAWVKNWAIEKQQKGEEPWELRLGIHSGEAVAGVVGKNKFAYDVWGDTVNLASRMESSGEVGKVNISETTYELIKHKFACTFRGKIEAKNKGELAMYFVEKVL